MRIAVLTPLPPIKSGIAGYSAVLLPALARKCDVVAVVDQTEFMAPDGIEVVPYGDFVERQNDFDAVYCQLGNNPYHEFVYRFAMDHPSTIVLHDLVLHHLIVEMTLARGDSSAYVDALRENHGAAGEAWARGRAAGLHGEIGNFLLPSSIAVANRSKRVIVHNAYAAETLIRSGVTTPIDIVGHPEPPVARRVVRSEPGLIGMFGFVTAAKRPEVVFEAFARVARGRESLRLLIVGEPAPNIDLAALARQFDLSPDRWEMTGFVMDEEFDAHLARVEKVVSLRYPSAGETSGALLRVFAFGKPVAVSDYAQFRELPADAVTKIPFDREVEALVEFLAEEPRDVARAQRAWLDAHASPEKSVAGYLGNPDGFRRLAGTLSTAPSAGIPLFPDLRLVSSRRIPGGLRLSLRNQGPTLRAAVYGEPAYRLIAKLFDGDREIHASWHGLSRDLSAGDEEILEISCEWPDLPLKLALYHALEGIPVLDVAPFARELVS